MSTQPRRYSYPTDMTEEEWAFAAPYLTLLPEGAGQRRHELRASYDALYQSPLMLTGESRPPP